MPTLGLLPTVSRVYTFHYRTLIPTSRHSPSFTFVTQAYTASGPWALVEQFLLIPCMLEPTSFTRGSNSNSGSGHFQVDVALCRTARTHAEWTQLQAPPPNDLHVEFGVQTMLL